MKGGREKGSKEGSKEERGLCLYCCMCSCKMEHATVGLLNFYYIIAVALAVTGK